MGLTCDLYFKITVETCNQFLQYEARQETFTSVKIKINAKDSFTKALLVKGIRLLSSTAQDSRDEKGLKLWPIFSRLDATCIKKKKKIERKRKKNQVFNSDSFLWQNSFSRASSHEPG